MPSTTDKNDHMSKKKLAKAELSYRGNCKALKSVLNSFFSNYLFNKDYYLVVDSNNTYFGLFGFITL